MIRKAIIVVLTLGAFSVTAISVISYGTPLRSEEFWLGDRDIFLFSCDAGHAKLSWVRAEEGGGSLDIRLFHDFNMARLSRNTIHFLAPNNVVQPSRPNQMKALAPNRPVPIPSNVLRLRPIKPSYARVLWRTKLATQPRSEWTQIQVWAWVVVAAFAAYPMLALVRGPLRRWRRRRKGLCIKCGYDLQGNESGVCSECGEAR